MLVESIALLQARLGLTAATKLAKDSKAFVIEWVDDHLHASGSPSTPISRPRDSSSSKVSRAAGNKIRIHLQALTSVIKT
jgi:hypothetical protein